MQVTDLKLWNEKLTAVCWFFGGKIHTKKELNEVSTKQINHISNTVIFRRYHTDLKLQKWNALFLSEDEDIWNSV